MAGVIEKDKMFLAIKLGRPDAILGEHELDIVDFEICFLKQFAAEGVFGALAEFYFSAWNTPEAGPFVGAHHEDAVGVVEDECPDGGDGWGMGLGLGLGAVGGGRWFQVHAVAFEELAQFAEVFDDEIGMNGAQLLEALVTGQHGAGGDPSVPCGFDVMLHVPDENGFVGCEVVFREDFADALAFVPDVEVGAFEEFAETGAVLLGGEMFGMNGTEDEGADAAFPAKDEKLAGVGQGDDGILDFMKPGTEPFFELFDGDVGDMAVVKRFEGEGKFGAKLFESELCRAGALEGVVAGFPDGGQIIHQCA
jgi:hypothetical protein